LDATDVAVLCAQLAQAVALAHAARMCPPSEIPGATDAASETMRGALARYQLMRRMGGDLSDEERWSIASLALELQRAFEALRDHAREVVRQISN
jgi:hypothetical protein